MNKFMVELKTKEWIKKSILKHGDLWDYTKSIFINSTTKLIIICNIHGEFLQIPAQHLNGSGCPKCGIILNGLSRQKTTEYFISEAIKVHGKIYSYLKSVYTGVANKLIIICKIHGDFEQTAGNHLMGRGCQKCAYKARQSNKEEFIEKSNPIHNWIYNYDKFIYSGAENKGIITCPKHGDFEQTPASHLSGSGCPDCGILKRAESQTLTFDEFIEKGNNLHNFYYNYEKSIYTGYKNYVNINCPEHGEFFQLALNHLKGHGCYKCGRLKTEIANTKSTTEFIKQSKLIHNNEKLSYDFVDYVGVNEKITIHCSENFANGDYHGFFEQTPAAHLSGRGCPKCSKKFNIPEQEITKFLELLGIQNIIRNNRKIIPNYRELDFYLPEYNLAIEYNGLYWHSDNEKTDNYHLEKTNDCLKQGIQLIHIFEDEFIDKPEIVFSRLRNLLGKSTRKIYARKTRFVVLNTQVAKQFLETNHIQGFTASQYYIGLANLIPETEKYEIVSVMTFGKLRKNLGQQNNNDDSFELVRFCNKLDTNVIGGASKLLNYFIKNIRNNKPTNIISYADKRWSQGKLYETLGFTLSHESKPNYFYINDLKRINRFNYRKDILVSKYNCQITDTERNFTKNVLGMNRIYDCGTYVYKLSII